MRNDVKYYYQPDDNVIFAKGKMIYEGVLMHYEDPYWVVYTEQNGIFNVREEEILMRDM